MLYIYLHVFIHFNCHTQNLQKRSNEVILELTGCIISMSYKGFIL